MLSLLPTGSDRDPNTSAARTLFVILFLLAVLMYTAYSASIISIMSSTRPVSNSLEEILEEGSKMGLALHNSHYYHTNFKVLLIEIITLICTSSCSLTVLNHLND